MDGGHNTKGPRQIGPSVEEIFRFWSIFTIGGYVLLGVPRGGKGAGGVPKLHMRFWGEAVLVGYAVHRGSC